MGFDWANLNRQLSYANDGLQFGLDMINARKSGKNIGESLSVAGINLFGNAAATQNAAELREYTGSNLGYLAKSAAGGNAEQALFNTTQATTQMYQLGMIGRMLGGGCCHHTNMMWDMYGTPVNYSTYTTPAWPGSNVFNNGFFQNNWF